MKNPLRIAMFYHSLISDWNHGNAHFLRGVVSELISIGHDVRVYEPRNAWSVENLVREHGETPLEQFKSAYPGLRAKRFAKENLDLDAELSNVDLVIVHEWNDHDLVARIGQHRNLHSSYRLLFHDTHHRSVTDSDMSEYDLSNYDGVLAFGAVIRDLYISNGWAARAWTWHEAADTRVFHPIENDEYEGDMVWIGNWGDGERTAEIHEYILEPVSDLGLRTTIHGVRYPDHALEALSEAGIHYRGWLPNFNVPHVFSRYRLTAHVPRRPYVEALPGIPTIRVFEALACGIPLISAPWEDSEGLFTPGSDYLIAKNGEQMRQHMRSLLEDKERARALAEHGLSTIMNRHTCSHRVNELLDIYASLEADR